MIPAETMRRGRAVGVALLAAALVLGALNVVWAVRHRDVLRPMQDGDVAPEVALPRIEPGGLEGAPLTLAELRGRVVVLDFWATWCQPCMVAMPRLDALQVKLGARGLVVVAVNLDDPAKARALWDQRRWQMTLVRDHGGAADRYGVSGIPHQVVIDRAGVVRSVHRGLGDGAAMAAELSRLLDE